MDVAIKSIEDSFVVSLLVSLWIVLLITLAICTKVVQIRSTVHQWREEKKARLGVGDSNKSV